MTVTEAPNLSSLYGNEAAKRNIEVGAVTNSNILIIGSPGTGKSSLARIYGDLLTPADVIRVSVTHTPSLLFKEVTNTLAGKTILLIADDLTGLSPATLKLLKELMDAGTVSVIATTTKCPCGCLSDKRHPCTCSLEDVQQHLSALSGSLLEEFDVFAQVDNLSGAERGALTGELHSPCEATETVAARVLEARQFLAAGEVSSTISGDASALLKTAIDRLAFSPKGAKKVIAIGKGIAALERSAVVAAHHIAEAVQMKMRSGKI